MKKIIVGIVGFGVVGKAYLRYLQRYGAAFTGLRGGNSSDAVIENNFIWDQKEVLNKKELDELVPQVKVFDNNSISLETLSSVCDYLLVSAGVPPEKIPEKGAHIVSEIDLFSRHNNKPVVAITGSLGKTTITTLLYKLLNVLPVPQGFMPGAKKLIQQVAVGGNIGVSMLDLLARKSDAIVLELSSFQLARSSLFAPNIAIINNVYPNHLDWHKTAEHYFASKCALVMRQTKNDTTVLNLSLFQHAPYAFMLRECRGKIVLIADGRPTAQQLESVPFSCYEVFFSERDILRQMSYKKGHLLGEYDLFNIESLSAITYEQNWLFVLATLHALDVNLEQCLGMLKNSDFSARLLADHRHRMECCLTINDVDFYNDSKATIVEATAAAVERLKKNNRPIILILGGLDKGVNRTLFVKKLKAMPRVKQVYYFGNEPDLFKGCKVFKTLDLVIDDLFLHIESGDQVLFSPSGSSFDLFDNYQQRGDIFKKLVLRKSALVH